MPHDETPSPKASSRVRERDATPELAKGSPTRSHHSHHSRSRDEKSSSSRRRERSPVDDEEEEARRRRRRREREREEEEDPEERRRRRKERERERERERDGGERRSSKRDRSRDSARSSSARHSEPPRDRPDRETRERERERRDREMRAEKRERDDYYAERDRERQQERRYPPRSERDFPPRSPPRRRRGSPSYDQNNDVNALLDEVDAEARSVFVSQIPAKLTSRDLGMFFEDMLGEGTVKDARIVTDRISRRSKGIGYVELSTVELVEKALALTGTIVMGLPIMVDLTDAERNRQAAASAVKSVAGLPAIPVHAAGAIPASVADSASHRDRHFNAEIPYHRLYVGNLNFDLTADDMKQVFEPFGELEFVDLHRDPITGKSKGFCFVQYVNVESAKSALATMNGFELAGRQLRVSTVNEKSNAPQRMNAVPMSGGLPPPSISNQGAIPESLEEHHGQRMDHAARQSLMMKLARTDVPSSNIHPSRLTMVPINNKPVIPVQPSVYILVNNVFNPEEETERDWDLDLADDFKGECENKYGKVSKIKVEKESQGEVYIQFESLDGAGKAVQGLNGRFFGGRSLVANYLPEMLFKAHVN